MRIAIVSDIHGNRTAFEAVLADLRITAPDLILHGGDLADSGSSPAWIVDRIRDLGWQGVVGNTDEMLFQPASLRQFGAQHPHLRALFEVIEQIAAASREALGEERLAWLAGLPRQQIHPSMALVHASPQSPWSAPALEAPLSDFESVYRPLALGPLGRPIVVYGHLHKPFQRTVPGLLIANSGSAGLPYDGDPRASYLLLDETIPTIRRVPYDIGKEQGLLAESGLPHTGWIARMLESGTFRMP